MGGSNMTKAQVIAILIIIIMIISTIAYALV